MATEAQAVPTLVPKPPAQPPPPTLVGPRDDEPSTPLAIERALGVAICDAVEQGAQRALAMVDRCVFDSLTSFENTLQLQQHALDAIQYAATVASHDRVADAIESGNARVTTRLRFDPKSKANPFNVFQR